MRVYIVLEGMGSWDDYETCINMVFTSLELAKQYADIKNLEEPPYGCNRYYYVEMAEVWDKLPGG